MIFSNLHFIRHIFVFQDFFYFDSFEENCLVEMEDIIIEVEKHFRSKGIGAKNIGKYTIFEFTKIAYNKLFEMFACLMDKYLFHLEVFKEKAFAMIV